MAHPLPAIPDPRVFLDAATAPEPARALYALAQASLGAETVARADAFDRELRARLASGLEADAASIAASITAAPSVAVARHLWRTLEATLRDAPPAGASAVAATVFALPIVLVAGIEGASGAASLPCVLADTQRVAAILREGRALAGCLTLGLANALVAADAIDVAQLPRFLAWQRLPDAIAPGAAAPERELAPAPCEVAPGHESVHLRFLVGTSIAGAAVDPLSGAAVAQWGMPLARELARQLAVGGGSVLALPRAPQRLPAAVVHGRSAQREVSAQLFASNAIRRLRTAAGEPAAVISAHRAPDAPGGGELRLSLSSPLDPRGAEGFRCPLHPLDRAVDVAAMLVDLMRDCRVTDVRVLDGVHAGRAPGSGLPLFFKPDTIPDATPVTVH